jgi:hypothetical protein
MMLLKEDSKLYFYSSSDIQLKLDLLLSEDDELPEDDELSEDEILLYSNSPGHSSI